MKGYFSLMKLFALLLVAPLLIYVLSLSNTIALYKEYRQVKASAGTEDVSDAIREYAVSAPMLSSGVLMRIMSGVCADNKVLVGRFYPKEIGSEGFLHLISAQVTLTGTYVGLLKVLDYVENIDDVRICNSEFSTVKVAKDEFVVQLQFTLMQLEEHRL